VEIIDTPLQGLAVMQSVPYCDDRGEFVRFFCAEELKPLLGDRQIAQVNYSRTRTPGTVRGVHYQTPPHAEMKFVRCTKGRVWDVAVDVRAGSPTFLQWYGRELAEGDATMIVIPEGFAHGVQSLEPDSDLVYLVTTLYHPPTEYGLRADDPRLGISWPLPPGNLSPRDASHPLLSDDFTGVVVAEE